MQSCHSLKENLQTDPFTEWPWLGWMIFLLRPRATILQGPASQIRCPDHNVMMPLFILGCPIYRELKVLGPTWGMSFMTWNPSNFHCTLMSRNRTESTVVTNETQTSECKQKNPNPIFRYLRCLVICISSGVCKRLGLLQNLIPRPAQDKQWTQIATDVNQTKPFLYDPEWVLATGVDLFQMCPSRRYLATFRPPISSSKHYAQSEFSF